MRKYLLVVVLMLAFSTAPMLARAQATTFTVQSIEFDDLEAYDLAVSPDGNTAAVYAGQISLVLLGIPAIEYEVDASLLPVRLIDLTTGEESITLIGHSDYITDVAFTPDSRQLASYHRNGDLILWDVASGEQVQHFTGIIGIGQLDFLPDGKTLVVYLADNVIGHFLVWDLESGFITRVWRASYDSFGTIAISSAPGNIGYRYNSFDVSPNGKLMATANPNGEVKVWNTKTLEQSIVQAEAEREAMFNVQLVAFSGDGTTLVYYDSISEQTYFRDAVTLAEKTAIAGGSRYFGVSPSGDKLAWASREALFFVDLAQPDLISTVLDFPDHLLVAMPSITFTPDNNRLIVGGFGSRENPNVLYVITLNG